MARMNKEEAFKNTLNFYLIVKYFNEETQEYKDAFEVLRISSPYTCMCCGNNSGLSFVEPKHNCRFPMFNKNHIPNEEYLKKKCAEYGWSWDKLEAYFQNKTKPMKQKLKNEIVAKVF